MAKMNKALPTEVFRSVIENSTDLTVISDAQGRCIYVSPQCQEIIGYGEEEILGKIMPDFIHPDDREKCTSAWTRVMAGESVKQFEYRILDKKGQIRWLSHSAKFVSVDKENIGLQNIIRNMTLSKQAEETFIREHNFAESLIETAQAIILVLDTQGRIVRYNKFMEDVSGHKLEHTKGKDWFSTFLPPGDHDSIRQLFRKVVSDIKSWGHINPIVRKDGKLLEIEWYNKTLKIKDNQVVGVLSVGLDITERKKIQAELQKTQRLESLGVLAGGIAHDFNNLLAGLFGYIDMAKSYGDINAEGNSYLDKAMYCFSRAKDLTQQLLTFAKGGDPIKAPVQVDTIIQESVQLSFTGSNVCGNMIVDQDIRTVEADHSQLSQVFNNILLNARQAMPNGGIVTIEVTNRELNQEQIREVEPGTYVQIEFQDQGTGISNDFLAKVFDPFFTTKQTGSGLGLASAYSIIKKHNGYITIDSELEVGTKVTILLPTSKKGILPTQNKFSKFAVKGGRILLMDDEEVVLEVTSSMLEKLGFEVVSARNGEAAIALYSEALNQNRRFVAVILDLTIVGGLGGEQTMTKLLEIDPNAVGIVSSGYSVNPILANPKEYGFRARLSKPYQKNELAEILTEILEDGVLGTENRKKPDKTVR